MLKRVEAVHADEFGMIEVRTTRVSIDVGRAAAADHEAFCSEMVDDDALEAQRLLQSIEDDIRSFWQREGLAKLEAALDMARRAQPGSWLGRSYAIWQDLVETRAALASGNINRAIRGAFFLGRMTAEVAMARRHGRQVRGKRRVDDGRGIAHDEQRENWVEKNAERDAYIEELDRRITTTNVKMGRAKKIKAGWSEGGERIKGLDRWVGDYNAQLDVTLRTKTLSEDAISRMIPTRK